jgi:hypothetical protein
VTVVMVDWRFSSSSSSSSLYVAWSVSIEIRVLSAIGEREIQSEKKVPMREEERVSDRNRTKKKRGWKNGLDWVFTFKAQRANNKPNICIL